MKNIVVSALVLTALCSPSAMAQVAGEGSGVSKAPAVQQPGAQRFPRDVEEFDQMFNQVKNWGRWGKDDQLGAANLVTEAKRKQAIALARTGRSVSMAHTIITRAIAEPGTPMGQNGTPFEVKVNPHMEIDITDTYKVDYHGFLHTHMDALCHFPYKGKVYNGLPAEKINTIEGCKELDITNLKNGIVTRGVLIDIPRLKNKPYLDPGEAIYVEDIEAWEKKSGVRVSPGDALFIRTGRWARWEKLGPWPLFDEGAAGIHASVIPWLKARGVSYLGSDGGSDVIPSKVKDVMFPIHYAAISGMGITLIDSMDFEAVAKTSAELKRWEFLFVVAPLPVPAGTGSPVNPTAIF